MFLASETTSRGLFLGVCGWVLREKGEEIIRIAAATDASAGGICRRTEVRQQFCWVINAVKLHTQPQTQTDQLLSVTQYRGSSSILGRRPVGA